MRTMNFSQHDLVWIYAALEDNDALWLQFKEQESSDLYFIELEVPSFVVLKTKLLSVRRLLNAIEMHSNRMNLFDKNKAVNLMLNSINKTLEKVEETFNGTT